VSEVAALGKRFLCLPKARPFGEQMLKARRLAALGAAVVSEVWPRAEHWSVLLRKAEALDPARIAALHDLGALAGTAAFLEAEAERASRYGQ
jgi:predicted glycosyltransferase